MHGGGGDRADKVEQVDGGAREHDGDDVGALASLTNPPVPGLLDSEIRLSLRCSPRAFYM